MCFLAEAFFAQAKNAGNSGRRSHKISVTKSKSDKKYTPIHPHNLCISLSTEYSSASSESISVDPSSFLSS